MVRASCFAELYNGCLLSLLTMEINGLFDPLKQTNPCMANIICEQVLRRLNLTIHGLKFDKVSRDRSNFNPCVAIVIEQKSR